MNWLTGILLLWMASTPDPVVTEPEALSRTYQGADFDICRIDLSQTPLSFHSHLETGRPYSSFAALKAELDSQGQELLFATNGGIFEPDFKPTGLYIENGKHLSPLNLAAGKGNFFLQPNGVFYLDTLGKAVVGESRQISNSLPAIEQAIQSGPILVLDRQIHPAFNRDSPNRYVRSGVGVDRQGKVVFAISHQAVNLHHFASLFLHELDCPNALYLDGAISQMYFPALGRNDSGQAYSTLIAISRPKR